MARPLWSDAGNDPVAIADLLDASAEAAGDLVFDDQTLGAVERTLLHRAAVLRAKRQIQDRHGDKDRILAQEVNAIDDLVRAANLLIERLREWYALHAPEVVRQAPDAERLAALVAEHGDRAAVLAALGDAEAATTSLGSDLGVEDLAGLQTFAGALRGIHESWRGLERRVEEAMAEVAPNLSGIVGPVIGARLIAQAGSLARLASMPAGTVQTLGAETALFRSIKEGTRPPKHGFLFQHPKVHQAPTWQRGPIARALALHAALAAKADAFTQNDLLPDLRARLEEDLTRIARERSKPPERRAPPPGRGPPRGPPRQGGARGPHKGGPPRSSSGGPPRHGGKTGGPPRKGGKPGGKPAGKPGGRPQGAFRRRGDGPAKPPGKGGGS